MHQHIECRAVIGAVHLARTRDVFRRAAGCARTQCKKGNGAGPGAVHKPGKFGLPIIAPHILVTAQGHACLKIGNRLDLGKGMIAPEPRILRMPHQSYELPFLVGCRTLASRGLAAAARIELEERRAVDHGLWPGKRTVRWRKLSAADEGRKRSTTY